MRPNSFRVESKPESCDNIYWIAHKRIELRYTVMFFVDLMTYTSAPWEPQFEYVVPAAALNGLVARVIARVIMLVALEQIARAQAVTFLQQSL